MSALDSIQRILPQAIDASARGAIVLLIALVLTTLLHRRSAATRHAIWVGAIGVQLIMLGLTLWGPRWRVAAPEPLSALVPASSEAPPVVDQVTGQLSAKQSGQLTTSPRGPAKSPDVPAAPASISTRTPADGTQSPSGTISVRAVLIALWAVGALAILLRLAIGTTIVARLAQKGNRIDDGRWLSLAQRLANTLHIQRPLILLRGDRIGVPITWGIIYPIVLLPDDADSWPDERRRFVLVHEMAHVKRLDALTQLVGQIALALFWFNPLVWIANRRMQLEREHACDDYVLRHGTQPSQYAADLLEMVQLLGTPAHRTAQPAFAALAMARRSEFEGRMLSILDPALDRHPLSKGRTLMSAFAALLLIVPLAALQPYRHVSTSASRSATSTSTSVATSVATSDSARAYVAGLPGTRADSLLARDGRMRGTVAASSPAQRSGSGTVVNVSGPKQPACSNISTGSTRSTSTHIHSDDDSDGSSIINYYSYNADHCTSATIIGKLTYSANEDDVVAMPFGAHATFEERDASHDREMTLTRQSDGAIAHLYRYNGQAAPYDDDAKRWFAGFLPKVLMEAGVNVVPRVARWRTQGGVDNVLTHIATISSSGTKRSHYEALLDVKGLSQPDIEHVVRQAGKNISSSGDLRAVLSKAAPQVRSAAGTTSALADAIGAVASSGDRAAVLEAFGQTNDRDQLLAVMRIAMTIPSSGDKSNLLSELAPRYLGRDDVALREAFFRTAETIPSSGDLASVLDDVIPFTVKSVDVAMGVITTVRVIASSGDRSAVLMTLAESGAVRTPALRDAYLRTAQELPSSSDIRNALEALTRH